MSVGLTGGRRAAAHSGDVLMRFASALAGLGQKRAAALAFLCGVLSTLSLPPVGAWPVLFLSFPLFLWLLDGRTGRKAAFVLGWCFGFGAFVTGLYWIANALLVFSDRLWWMVPFAAVGLPAFLALYSGLAALAAWHIPRGALRLAGFVLAWLTAEWLRGVLFTGFPWNLTGYAWAMSDSLIQSASLWGIYGVSALVTVMACLPAALPGLDRRGRGVLLLVMAAIPLAAWGHGSLRLSDVPPVTAQTADGPGLRIVQPAIPQREKWGRPYQRRNFDSYLSMSLEQRPDWVKTLIWPETAATFYLEEADVARGAIGNILPEGGLLITGAPRRETDPLRLYNGIVAVDGDGAVIDNYNKSHLVPFGEYVPLRDILPIEKVTQGATDYSAGQGVRSLTLPGLPPVSMLICYEAIFPGAVANPAQRPGWLLNLTNDAWYGETAGPHQHLAIVKVRAVEEGMPMVRAANTGISALFDAYGREVDRLGLNKAGYLDVRLPDALADPTPFSHIGNVFFLLMIGLGWLLVGVLILRGR